MLAMGTNHARYGDPIHQEPFPHDFPPASLSKYRATRVGGQNVPRVKAPFRDSLAEMSDSVRKTVRF